MIGNMYTWAFAEERIQAVNEAHRAEAAALNRVAQAADSTGQVPHRGRMPRLIRAVLRGLRVAPKPHYQA
jgi:hypothetical protein